MTRPSDFSPREAIELRNSADSRDHSRRLWTLRIVGVAVLITGWLAVSVHDFGTMHFVADSVIFAALGAFAFGAAVASRRTAVNLEKKLRLRLLVHNMELENMAMRDELTQLFNRRYLFDRLERELQTARGFERPLSVILIDLGCLGEINERSGFQAGDRALAAFGQFLLNHTRATDLPARIAGDEFAIILPDTSKRGAYTMMERLIKALAEDTTLEGAGLPVELTASMAISGYPWGGDSVDALMRHAGESLRAGRETAAPADAAPPEAAPEGETPRDTGDGASVPALYRKGSDAPAS